MSFSASQKTINDILSASNEYLIPKNQRKYVWGEHEWQDLYDDLFLIERDKDKPHFLGSFVFSKKEKNNQFSVIDGQQRLTTLSVLIASLVRQLIKEDNKNVAKSFINNFLSGDNNGEDYSKIDRDDQFFLTYLIEELKKYDKNSDFEKLYLDNFKKKDKYNNSIFQCFQYFNDKLDDFLKDKKKKCDVIIKLKEKIVYSEVIEIIVSNDMDGFRVFETLNARGIPLENHELVKNLLYSYLPKAQKQKDLTAKWNEIVNNLLINSKDYLSIFLTHYVKHRFKVENGKSDFRYIRENTKKTEANDLLMSLYKNSKYYSYILNPDFKKDNRVVYTALSFFKNSNFKQVRPLLLSLFEANEDKKIIKDKDLNKCISYLEKFYFLYVVVSKNSTNTIDSTINNLALTLYEQKEEIVFCDTLKNTLSHFINKENLKNNFIYLGYSNKNKKYSSSANGTYIKYILKKFEISFSNDKDFNFDDFTIEHILPDDENNESTAYIGNLLPLSKKLNGDAKDKPFKDKLEIYKKYNAYTMNRFIERYKDSDKWTIEMINSRSQQLYEYGIKNIWNIDE